MAAGGSAPLGDGPWPGPNASNASRRPVGVLDRVTGMRGRRSGMHNTGEPGGPVVAATDGPSHDEAATAVPAVRSAPNRRTRLSLAAAARGVPLPTILVTVTVVAGVYLLGQLAYRLRDVFLLIVIAAFLALVLNPLVVLLQGWGLPVAGCWRIWLR